MPSLLRVFLIGGASHTGKSTLAAVLARRLGGEARSTDQLARHPGRPWATAPNAVPPHVAEHYGTLDTPALIASVLAHYRRLAPQISGLIDEAPEHPLVLEGSALLPETIASLTGEGVAGVILTAPDALLTARIHAESAYADRDAEGRRLIDAFLARALAFNRLVAADAAASRLPAVNLMASPDPVSLAEQVIAPSRQQSI